MEDLDVAGNPGLQELGEEPFPLGTLARPVRKETRFLKLSAQRPRGVGEASYEKRLRLCGRHGQNVSACGSTQRRNGCSSRGVDLCHELTVRGSGGGEISLLFRQFLATDEELLLKLGDLAGERVDVSGGPEPGGFPCGSAEVLGESSFKPGDVRGESSVSGGEVRNVGQQ
ncbi:hypothetical protein ACWHBW_27110 [Streptomyces albidoflavus]|uniref:hypothetical protein n=1 Tax=Streptomyces albidoflavus TaxID=1886 RepID=UPI002E101A36|nr:hypothetical protein OG695_31285 [Streptomyces albidoflavus]